MSDAPKHVAVRVGVEGRPDTYLSAAAIGHGFLTFRIDPEMDLEEALPLVSLPGVYRSIRGANAAIKIIAAKTGEKIDNSHWRNR